MCTTSGAVCGGYKRMLGRKKRYTEPAGKKEWSDGGQAVSSCLNWQLRPVDTPGHLYRLACTKQKTSLPLRRAERSVCLSKDGASGLGKYLGHDLPAVRALLLGVEVHINGTCRRKVPEPVQGVQIPALIFVRATRCRGYKCCSQRAVLSPGLLYNESRNRRR